MSTRTVIKFVGGKRSGDSLNSEDRHCRNDISVVMRGTFDGELGRRITIPDEGEVIDKYMTRWPKRKCTYVTYEVADRRESEGKLLLLLKLVEES